MYDPENVTARLTNLRTVTDDKEALLNLDAGDLAVLYAEAADIALESIEALALLEMSGSF